MVGLPLIVAVNMLLYSLKPHLPFSTARLVRADKSLDMVVNDHLALITMD